MYEQIITPNMKELIGKSDSESIQNALDYAHKIGVNSVTIPRMNERTGEPFWTIDKAIILSSNTELILDNCYLKQKEGYYDNIFRNFEDTDKGHTLEEQQRNIYIRGKGNAVLDGGAPNDLNQGTSLKNGLPHVSKNNPILFYNIRDFVLEGFSILNQRWWGINLIHAERGRISNLYIEGNCDRPTQDGIDIRVGCSNIIIENIRGQAGDDFIALSAIGKKTSPTSINAMYGVEGHSEDIHDIIIRNIIATSVECAVIAIRNSFGKKIYNITIDTIHCMDNYAEQDGKRYPDYPSYRIPKFDISRTKKGVTPYALVRVGQEKYYGAENSVLGEVYGIHATNLYASMGCVVMVNISLENSYFGNIHAENGVDYILTTKSGRTNQLYGADIRNVLFENIFMNNTDNDYACAFDLDINEKNWKVENLIIKDAFLGNCKKAFNVKCDGEVTYHNLYGTYITNKEGIAKRDGK